MRCNKESECHKNFLIQKVMRKIIFILFNAGPCKTGEILGLSKWKKSPKCIINQCKKDGEVYYKGSCHPLDSNKPCKIFNHLIGRNTYLTVKESTFELVCANNDHTIECDNLCCVNAKGDQKCFKKRRMNLK